MNRALWGCRTRARLIADPNPVYPRDSSGLGSTTLRWHAPEEIEVELRVSSPDGPLLSRQAGEGSVATGKWVHGGMCFYLQDVTDGRRLVPENTLGTVTVHIVQQGPRPRGILQRMARAATYVSVGKVRLRLEVLAQGGYWTPEPGKVRFGSFGRVTPISRVWGFDRGQPVDRYYIEQFLTDNFVSIRGRVLEIDDDTYARRFGGAQVTATEILTIDGANPKATIVADLANGDGIPSNAFDCVILTQTLQLIFDLRGAVATVARILKPGGTVLMTAPGISPTGDGAWGEHWCWALTARSARSLFAEAFGPQNLEVWSFGNVLSATALLQGIAAEELSREELDYRDAAYAVIVAVRAVKRHQ